MKSKNKIVTVILFACVLAATGSTSYVLASGGASPKYTEPEKRPEGLPDEAVFNPYTNEYYLSTEAKWDTELQKYIPQEKDKPEIAEFSAENITVYSQIDWINDHQGTTDPVEMALITYSEIQQRYRDEHPEVMARSDWCIDLDGEFSIITDLGVAGLPGLLKEVDGPFRIPVMFGIENICKVEIEKISHFHQGSASDWKSKLNAKSDEAAKVVAGIINSFDTGQPVSADEMTAQLSEVGVFALPYFYDEVIGNADESFLLPYAARVLPDKVLEEYGIDTAAPDPSVLKEALASCADEIEIINTLHAE